MKSYNLELLKLSGLDFLFKKDVKNQIPTEIANNSNFLTNNKQTLAVSPVSINQLKIQYSTCRNCPLHETRKNFVYGDGNPQADIMLIGEAPGAKEDSEGHVFIGPAGQLLTKMLNAINIQREDVYITNIVKCHPPRNRDPFPAERQSCLPYLEEQIKLIKPKVIILLGKIAANSLLPVAENASLSSLRTKEHYYHNIRTFVTYHPSALLHNPAYKLPAWHDLQHIQHYLENNS